MKNMKIGNLHAEVTRSRPRLGSRNSTIVSKIRLYQKKRVCKENMLSGMRVSIELYMTHAAPRKKHSKELPLGGLRLVPEGAPLRGIDSRNCF
jgi:hypothetical protein